MTSDLDQRIAALLNADAPPERDPAFRIQLLVRRERKQFHRGRVLILFGMLALIVTLWSGYRSNASLPETLSLVLLELSLAGLLACLPVLIRALRRSRAAET